MSSILVWSIVAGAWGGLMAFAFRFPGAGLALALLVGRYPLPLRVTDPLPGEELFPGAVVPLIAAAVSLALSDTWRVRPNMVHAALGAIAVSLLTTAIAVPDLSAYGFEKTLMFALVALPLTILASGLDSHDLGHFATVLVVYPLLAGVAAIAASGDLSRLSPIGGGPIVLAQQCSIGLLIAVAINAHKVPSLLPRWLTTVAPFILIFIIVLSDSRAPLIAVLLVALLFRPAPIDSFKSWFQLLGAGVILYAAFSAGLLVRLKLLYSNQFSELQRSRLDVWEVGWNGAKSATPFGRGPGCCFEEASLKLRSYNARYPHNLFLETTSDTGWIVGLLTLVVACVVCLEAIRGRRQYPDGMWGSCACFALLASQTSGDLFSNRFFFVLSAIFLSVRQSRRSNLESPPVALNILQDTKG